MSRDGRDGVQRRCALLLFDNSLLKLALDVWVGLEDCHISHRPIRPPVKSKAFTTAPRGTSMPSIQRLICMHNTGSLLDVWCASWFQEPRSASSSCSDHLCVSQASQPEKGTRHEVVVWLTLSPAQATPHSWPTHCLRTPCPYPECHLESEPD